MFKFGAILIGVIIGLLFVNGCATMGTGHKTALALQKAQCTQGYTIDTDTTK